MDTKKEVTHTGIVGKIDKKGIKVTIGILAGCADCQINGNCNMAEQSVKELFIECDSSQYKTGQRVLVSLKSANEMNTRFLKYILPFMVLLLVMFITSLFTKNEVIIGIASLLSLFSYYIILFRIRIKEKVKYGVTPLFE